MSAATLTALPAGQWRMLNIIHRLASGGRLVNPAGHHIPDLLGLLDGEYVETIREGRTIEVPRRGDSLAVGFEWGDIKLMVTRKGHQWVYENPYNRVLAHLAEHPRGRWLGPTINTLNVDRSVFLNLMDSGAVEAYRAADGAVMSIAMVKAMTDRCIVRITARGRHLLGVD